MEKEFISNVTDGFKDRDKAQREKFIVSMSMADPKSKEILDKYGISLSKSSQFIVLTQDPKTLTQSLELAEKMGFMDAYKKDPKRLTQLVSNVIKRMAKCDALGINYKKEDGNIESFIFSERAFNEALKPFSNEVKEVIDAPTISEESDINIDEVKEYATRILEQFAMTEQQDAIFSRLEEIKGNGLGTKEMLIEAFKVVAGNNDLLNETIDEILSEKEEKGVELGRAA